MKRKVWNKTTTPHRAPTGPWLSVHPGGTLLFTKDLVDKLDLTNTGVSFVQDEERPADWYLELDDSPDGFKIRHAKSAQYFAVQCAALAKTILSSTGNESRTKFLVATEPAEKKNQTLCHNH